MIIHRLYLRRYYIWFQRNLVLEDKQGIDEKKEPDNPKSYSP